MGDTCIVYTDEFGLSTFRREIVAAFSEDFYETITKDLTLPDIHTECNCGCKNMAAFLKRLKETIDPETLKTILYKVRHGLKVSQCEWARKEYLEIGDMDAFLKKHLETEIKHFEELNREGKDFYGQDVTDEVLAFILSHPSMMAPVRNGNKLLVTAFPANIKEYLKADTEQKKRYYACHCPFAKESILQEQTVSATLCNCSLGHVMNFVEAFLGKPLNGRVLTSVLNGDLLCTYEIDIE